MEISISVYLFCLALLVVITTSIGVRAFSNWQMPGARTLGVLMIAMAIWTAFYLVEILHPSLSVKILARKILYIGMVLSPPYWLAFALRYTGFGTWWSSKGRSFLLALPGGIAFLFGMTNEFHHLLWKSLSLAKEQPAPLVIEYGPAFWIFTYIAYGLIVAGFIVYAVAHFNSDKILRVRTGVMLTGAFLSVIFNVGFLFFNNGLHLDPTPLSFAVSAPLLAFGFFRFGTIGLFPLAASLVVENLQDAIIVVNHKDKITDINHAARDLVKPPNNVQGASAFSALPHVDILQTLWDKPNISAKAESKNGDEVRFYEVRVFPIRSGNTPPLGRVIVYHDITNEQNLLRAEKLRSQQLSLLEEAGRRIADSFDELEILQRTVDVITQQFGYPETAISLLTKDNMLEAATISGTEDFGYRSGYQQKLGEGIIGYTASLEKTYVTGNVSQDPHYFSTSTKSGSALCTPIFKQSKLFGVLYVESFELNAFDELDVITLETLASQVSESLQRASLYAQTQENLRTLATIQEISKLIASSLDLETISQTVVKSLKESFGYSHTSIYFLKEDYLHLSAQVGHPEEMVVRKIHISQGSAGKTIRSKQAHFIEDTKKDNTFLKANNGITSEICVPLLKEDAVLGILNVESTPQRILKQSDVELLTAIAGPIAVAVDNARLHAELKRMATTDAVTGLANRHVFEQAIHAEVERAERNGTPLSLIVFDIDFFKQYNDQWGHPAGDARLKAVAEIIKLNLRKYDIAARYGGDEFAIILSDCNQQDAIILAHRLRKGAHANAPEPIKEGEGQAGHTLSIGIATFPQDATHPSELLIAADNAAMRAKQNGRNRVKLASDYETH